MRRKLVKQGHNALTVTLPSTWTQKFKLKPGDEVVIQEKLPDLMISTDRSFSASKTELDISELDDALVWTYIIAAYRNGADEITVKFRKGQQNKLLQQVTDALLGMAIISQSETTATLKYISGTTDDTEFDNILRRTFLLLKAMGQDTFDGVKNNKQEILKNMEYQDYNINKFTNFCLRILKKKGHVDYSKTPVMTYVIAELENLGDEITRLSLDVVGAKISPRPVKILQDVLELYDLFYQFFYKSNKELATKMLHKKEQIQKDSSVLLKNAKPAEIIFLFHLNKIVHLIINLTEKQVMLTL